MGKIIDKLWDAIDALVGSDNPWDAYGPPILPERPKLPEAVHTFFSQVFNMPAEGGTRVKSEYEGTFTVEQATVNYTTTSTRAYVSLTLTGRDRPVGHDYRHAEYTVFSPFTEEKMAKIPADYLPLVRSVMDKIKESH